MHALDLTPNPYRLDNLQTGTDGKIRRDLVHPVILTDANVTLEALLDTGAYFNYLSVEVLKRHSLDHLLKETTGEQVQLGGTQNFKNILGRVSLTVSIADVTAKLIFNVFETDRDCIIGLESLLMLRKKQCTNGSV